MSESAAQRALYRGLPSVDEAMRGPEMAALEAAFSRALVLGATRAALTSLRQRIAEGQQTEVSLREDVDRLHEAVGLRLRESVRPSLRGVINATGVVLQTNLGRAPLGALALERIAEVGRGYANLEMDLERGERGSREEHGEPLILELLRSRGVVRPLRAAVVNNCAAACLLALSTIAEGGEVIVSRGELVEIGGGFRVPDILRSSGAVLHEVGTTNRTRIGDYAEALNDRTRLILRVHRSNFRMEGFTEQPTLEQLRELGARGGIPVLEDQGTGCVIDLEELGLPGESSLLDSLRAGIDLVAASGDKLLGGPQCGLLMGAPELIGRMRAHPLFRAMRVDKLTYAALQGTLLEYLAGREERVPAIALLRTPAEALLGRAESLRRRLTGVAVEAEVVETRGVVGGGTTPGATLPGWAVRLRAKEMTEGALATRLRAMDPPIVTRTQDGSVLLDLRAVFPEQDEALARGVRAALARAEEGA